MVYISSDYANKKFWKIHQHPKNRQIDADITSPRLTIYIYCFLSGQNVFATHMHGPVNIFRAKICMRTLMKVIDITFMQIKLLIFYEIYKYFYASTWFTPYGYTDISRLNNNVETLIYIFFYYRNVLRNDYILCVLYTTIYIYNWYTIYMYVRPYYKITSLYFRYAWIYICLYIRHIDGSV